MRIRSIKPEYWRSSSISALSLEDRLLFIGLWSYVDDNGVGVDRLSVITADLFADDLERDPRETFARVSRGILNLFEAGRISRYTVHGDDYLSITNWAEHQRIDKPGKPRYPAPTTGDASIRETVATPSRHPRDTLAPGAGEQGNRGTGEQPSLREGAQQSSAPKSQAPAAKAAPTKRGTRMMQNWRPEQSEANDKAHSIHEPAWLELELERFRDYWTGITGAKGLRDGWDGTWRNWIRRAAKFEAEDQPKTRTTFEQMRANAAALDAEDEATALAIEHRRTA